MERIRNARAMQPRPQQGTSLLVSMTIHATDEGVYVARVAWKDSSSGRILAMHAIKVMWEGGQEDVEHFASEVAAGVTDVIEWTVV